MVIIGIPYMYFNLGPAPLHAIEDVRAVYVAALVCTVPTYFLATIAGLQWLHGLVVVSFIIIQQGCVTYCLHLVLHETSK